MIIFAPKDPGAILKYAVDFSAELGGDTIQTGPGSPSITPTGVTVIASNPTQTQVQLQLSGGTAGTVATVAVTVATSGGETLNALVVLPIGGEAVDLDTAKAAQRLEGSDEDALLAAYLRAAIRAVEARTSKNLTHQVETQVVDGFPSSVYLGQGGCLPPQQGLNSGGNSAIRLFKGPVTEILSVKYDDQNGVEQTLSSFRLVEGRDAKLLPAFGESWPVTARGPGTVRIQYIAGFDPADRDLAALTQAVILLFGHYNANREAVIAAERVAAVELPLGVEALLAPYCVPGLA